MAENKKSVILYCDIIHTFEALEDAEAGKLIKHFLRYVNDLNPVAPDKLTQIAFEPIKQQLKRDLVKWDAKIEVRSDAGRLGGLKSGEARRKQKEANEANALKSKQKEANEAVNVTVNVNDTVNVINKYIPELSEFLLFCKETLNEKYLPLEFSLKAKYESWIEAGWKDGNGKKIKNWKTKIKNTIPFLKPMQQEIKSERQAIPLLKQSDYEKQPAK